MKRPFPMHELIACVEREITLRRKVYPQWVAGKRLTQAMADAEIEKMEAVLALLTEHEAVAGELLEIKQWAMPFARAACGLEGLQQAVLAHWGRNDETGAWWLAGYVAAMRVAPAQWVGLRKALLGYTVR